MPLIANSQIEGDRIVGCHRVMSEILGGMEEA